MKLGLQSTGFPTKERLRKLPVNYYGPIPRLNSVFVLIFFCGMFNDWTQERNKFKVAENQKYKETDSLNSVQSSL